MQADPNGDFIRHFVPELSSLDHKGTLPTTYVTLAVKLHSIEIHHPSIDSVDALGYPRPIVDHSEARQRCLRRLKDIGKE